MTAIIKAHPNDIIDPKFFTGGNAVFTVGNGRGAHCTFRIRKPNERAPFFVKLLTGQDNTNDYTYIGIYQPPFNDAPITQGYVPLKLTKGSKLSEFSTPVKVFNWAVRLIFLGQQLPEGYTIRHEGRCCRCGRLLTTPESIQRGIGPECAKAI